MTDDIESVMIPIPDEFANEDRFAIIIIAPTGLPGKALRALRDREDAERIKLVHEEDLPPVRDSFLIIDESSTVGGPFFLEDRIKDDVHDMVIKLAKEAPDPTDDFTLDRKKRKDWKSPYDRRRR